MSKEEEKKECKCLVHCECFKKFLIVSFGSFLGVFFALCLFTAIHKPCGFPPSPKNFEHQVPNVERQLPPMHNHYAPVMPMEHVKR